MSILDDENILVDNAAVYCNLAAKIPQICKSIIENELNKYADSDLAISESDISYINQRELIGRLFNDRANVVLKIG